MGDCGNLRCVQEKRHFRKELASWYKKIPFTIGLELIAENIAGNASGHIKTLLLPFNDMEIEEANDFQPELDSSCIFCQGKARLESPEQENIPEMISCSEPMSSQLQKSTPEQRCSNQRNDSLAESVSASLTAATPQLPVLEGLNSFYNQLAMTSLLYQQQQLQTAAVQAALSAGAPSSSQRQPTGSSTGGVHVSAAEVALDLRAEAGQSSPNMMPLAADGNNLKVPEIRHKKKDNSLKRSYTDRELSAAVEAIKSGSVGTRRAAQMYGVPRSTLRNKVFKSAEMSRQLPYNEEDLRAAEAGDQSCQSPTGKSNSDSEASSPRSRQASPQGKPSEEKTADMSQYNRAAMKQLEEFQAKQGITDQLNMMSQQNRLLGDLFNPMNFAATSYPFFMPQYSALSAMPGFDYMNPYASSMLMPYLPDMMKNLAQKQFELDCLGHNSTQKHNSSTRRAELGSNSKQPKKDDIKVPAYKPSTSHMANDHDVASRMAKSMVKKETVERHSAFPSSDYLQNIISQTPSTSKRTSPPITHSSRKKSLLEQSASQTLPSPHSLSNGNSSGKKRPKRGQYRKYDSERLADAVKAVQRGEMSVHRAGTHYGVPHSTLEYKVKERHLLRKKKLAENGESKSHSSAGVSSKPSTTHTARNSSPDSNQSASKRPSASPSLQAAESAVSAGENDDTRSFLDFTPSAYQMDAPASELLLKLHAKAHQRANEIMNGTKSRTSSEHNENIGKLV